MTNKENRVAAAPSKVRGVTSRLRVLRDGGAASNLLAGGLA